ncbi:MAG: 2-oxo-4-hydroxy-4-carboxy-5-ureidoimidazoline decarboxylase [Chloroflexota bacterium]|nr:2-oxo-4-hydroxy-4-carboxy-5-ureidoimidazoline decarboxylase [Chloroflexota bacterium]
MPSQPPWTLAELNGLDQAEWTERLGFLHEGSPWIAAVAWEARPFADLAALDYALGAVVELAPRERHIALIAAHPDLVGQAALAGTLTRESTGEQTTAGLDPGRLSPDEMAAFAALNAAYRARFGFPFVICARENTKASILAGFQTRLGHDRDREIATALGEIAKIRHHRLRDVIAESKSQGQRTR